MRCEGCGFETPPDFSFCPACGKPRGRVCPACSFSCAADFSFCPKCGKPLRETAPDPKLAVSAAPPAATIRWASDAEADRRPITALFADLCGFTALGERLDPERIVALQRDLFRELTAGVESFGGHVDKVMGDGLLALFGAPLAHEDDAERALNCAIALRMRTADLGGRWRDLREPLALHIGVNTGPVVAGTVGTGGYSVTGDTVNSASRLQGLASPGEIYVGPLTYRLTRHAFTFEPLGAFALRGRAAALDAYRLVEPLATPRPSRGLESHGLRAPFVGRAEELGRIQAAWDRMLAGRAQVVRLVGEAGIGKTRLVDAFLARLREQGQVEGITLRRAAASALEVRSYGVMAALLREGYGLMPNEAAASAQGRIEAGLRELGLSEEEVARVLPVVARLLDIPAADGVTGPADPQQLRRQIVLAVRTMLEHRLSRGAVLLVIEDLHWADAASVELLRILADRLFDRRLMLLVTHRPDFAAAAVVTTETAQTALRLSSFTETEGAALFDALFGQAGSRLPKAMRRLVIERAGGNPLYLEEILRGLIEDGILVRDGDGWKAGAGSGARAIPLTIQGLLLARLDRLPAESRRVVQEAAVLGPVFETRLLARISAHPAAVDDAMDLLSDTEILEELPRGAEGGGARRFRFRHALMRDVAYENLLLGRRTALHRAAADALEDINARTARRPEDLVALARHFGLGGEPARGAAFWVEAGDWARNIYANEDAIGHYRRALDLLETAENSETERLAVAERIGDLLGRTGSRAEALDRYEAAHAAYAALGNRLAQARLCRKIAAIHWDAGERERALERCRSGLKLIEDGPADLEVAHQYEEIGRLAFRSGDFPEAARWAHQALAYVDDLISVEDSEHDGPITPEWRREAAEIVSHAHNTLGAALAREGRAAEAVARVERSVSVAEEQGLMDSTLRGYSNLGVLYSTLQPQRAIEACRKGLEVARRIGDLGFEARLNANLAVACCTFTDRCSEEGLAAADRALDLDRQLDLRDHLAVPLTVLAQIHQCHGSPELAMRYYREALEVASEIGEAQLLFPCYEGLAVLHLDQNEEAVAEGYFRKAQDVCERAGLDPDALVVLPFLA